MTGSGNTYTADILNRYYGDPDAAYKHPILSFNLFYPREDIAGPRPAGGWPVVMYSELSGFVSQGLNSTVGDAQIIQQAILDRGMALAYALLPVCRGGTTPTGTDQDFTTTLATAMTAGSTSVVVADGSAFPAPTGGTKKSITVDSEVIDYTNRTGNTFSGLTRTAPTSHSIGAPVGHPFNAGQQQWGKAYRGNGCMVGANGNVTPWPGDFPSGYAAAYPTRPHPWLDPLWLNSSKGAMWLTQHLRYYGLGGLGPTDDVLLINPNKILAHGSSAAAISFLWPLCQPDRAGKTGIAHPMGQVSTRLQGAALRQITEHWLTFSFTAPPVGYMFGSVASSPDWDIPGDEMGDTDFNDRGECALDFYGKAEAEVPGITALNNNLPVWISTNTPMDADILALSAATRYVGQTAQGLEGQPHSVYHEYRAKSVFPNWHLVLEDDNNSLLDSTAPYPADEIITTAYHWNGTAPETKTGAGNGLETLYWPIADFLAEAAEAYEPVEEEVLRALETLFRGVKATAGYNTDVAAVYRWEDQPSQLIGPTVMLNALGTQYLDEMEASVMYKVLHVDITLVVKGWQNQSARISAFIADIEKALYADVTLGGLSANLHVRNVDRQLLNPSKEKYAAAFVRAEVKFRHLTGDPYTPFPQSM